MPIFVFMGWNWVCAVLFTCSASLCTSHKDRKTNLGFRLMQSFGQNNSYGRRRENWVKFTYEPSIVVQFRTDNLQKRILSLS